MRALLPATLAAMLALPLMGLMLSWAGNGSMEGFQAGLFIALMVFVVVAPHVLLLGLPAFLLLRRAGRLNGGSMAAAGFLAGALPLGLYGWPYWRRHPGYTATRSWLGDEVTVVADGVPTLHGWLVHLQTVAVLGLLGTISALAFWWVWLYSRRRMHV